MKLTKQELLFLLVNYPHLRWDRRALIISEVAQLDKNALDLEASADMLEAANLLQRFTKAKYFKTQEDCLTAYRSNPIDVFLQEMEKAWNDYQKRN